jgi:maleate isomerase
VLTPGRPVRIGVIVPSSNSALEPVVSAMAAQAPFAVHYTRVRVVSLANTDEARAQFSDEYLLDAAGLLADVGVDAIAWAGTSGLWLGLEEDRRLCGRIQDRFGCPATTSAVAVVEALHSVRAATVGVAVPYTAGIETQIHRSLEATGLRVVSGRRLDLEENVAIGRVSADAVRQLVAACDTAGADAIATICTNVDSATLASAYERQHGRVLIDSISATVWAGLRLLGPPRHSLAAGWGRLFALGDTTREVRHG